MPKKWTVMIYLAGDNNLAEEMVYAIKEIYRIGVTKDFDVVIFFASSGVGAQARGFVLSQETFEPKRRDALTGQDRPSSRIVFNYDEDDVFRREEFKFKVNGYTGPDRRTKAAVTLNENSADPRILKDFIVKSIQQHSADSYMLILSGHGNGVQGNFLTDVDLGNSRENRAPGSLSLPGLKWALKTAIEEVKSGQPTMPNTKTKIDILGLDSCLMSMAEVGYQVRDYVRYAVGAEGFELNTGWPYHRLLEEFIEDFVRAEAEGSDAISPRNIAIKTVVDYIRYYQEYESTGQATDQAACDLDQAEDLRNAVGLLAKALLNGLKGLHKDDVKDAVVLTHWEAQSYCDEQYTDLYDFCNLLADRCKDWDELEEVKSACYQVIRAIKGPFVIKSCYTGAEFQHSHGIAIYFPWTDSDFLKPQESRTVTEYKGEKLVFDPNSRYENLDFAKDTNWIGFLREYVKLTQRRPRDEDKHTESELIPISAPDIGVLLVRRDPPISRRDPPISRSGSLSAGRSGADSMKNKPKGFYRDNCK